MPPPPTITEAGPADAEALRRLHEVAFPGPDEAALVADLVAGGHAVLSLVAREGDAVVGHVLFSRLVSRPTLRASVLAPLAVRPDRQRGGIATRLVREGLARLEEAGEDLVTVLGDPAFYGRFGFRPGRPDRIVTPWPVSENQWLALADKPVPVRLDLAYPPPFARFE